MQLTMFYNKRDEYLIQKLDNLASQERKSRSAMIMTILEYHLESHMKLGEILRDQGILTHQKLQHALTLQRTTETEPIGEILICEGFVRRQDVERALQLQRLVIPLAARGQYSPSRTFGEELT